MIKYPLLGSHVKMSAATDYLVGSVMMTIKNNANTFMIFTGAPQNSKRIPTNKLKVQEMNSLLKEHHLDLENLVVHAPYLINIANSINPSTWKFSVDFLMQEIKRCEEIGINTLVLHPGAYTQGTPEESLNKIIEGLNIVTKKESKVKIALETMSGKGTEVGTSLEQLKYILDHVKNSERIGICLDTCHLNDSGYDLKKWEEFKAKIKDYFGFKKVFVIHLNDSKNSLNSHKDRHENIGYGTIGFQTLNKIVWDEDFKNIPKILETPYVNDLSPYQQEIADLQNQKFSDPFKNAKK